MGNRFRIVIEKNDLPHVGKRTRQFLDRAVRKTAINLEGRAKQNAPVDTAALRNSIYTATNRSSGYTKAASEARAANSGAEMLPEVSPQDKLGAVVAVGVGYGAYPEFGTEHMTAQPYLTPAAEAIQPEFEAAIAEAIRKGAGE